MMIMLVIQMGWSVTSGTGSSFWGVIRAVVLANCFAFAGFTVIKPKCCPLICPLFLLFSTTKEIVAVCYENDSCFCN